nr:proline-rich protein LAS17-like [Camelus dromedarius]
MTLDGVIPGLNSPELPSLLSASSSLHTNITSHTPDFQEPKGLRLENIPSRSHPSTAETLSRGGGPCPGPRPHWACSVAERVRAGPGARARAAPGRRRAAAAPPPPPRPGRRARPRFSPPQPGTSRRPPPCSLSQSRPPEGANKRQPVVCPVTIYQLSAPQGSAAAARAGSSACRKCGESSATSAAAVPGASPGFFSERRCPRVADPNAPAHPRLHASLRKLLQLPGHFCNPAERIHQSFAQRQPQARWLVRERRETLMSVHGPVRLRQPFHVPGASRLGRSYPTGGVCKHEGSFGCCDEQRHFPFGIS